jgi:hypothetical protein
LTAQASSPRSFILLCKTADAPNAWREIYKTSGVQDWTVDSKSFAFGALATNVASTAIASRLVVLGIGVYENASTAVSITSIKFKLAQSAAVQVLEQRIADLVYKLYGVINLEDAPE